MALPDPLGWPPNLRPISATWQLNRAAGVVQAASGRYDATDWGYGLHRCTATFTGAGGGLAFDMFKFEAFVNRISGGIVPVRVPRWERGLGPRGGISGFPQIQGAGQIGDNIQVDAISGTNPVWLAGDFISFDDHLYCIRSDVNHSGGAALISVEPPVAVAPPDNEPIYWQGIYQQTGGEYAAAQMVMVTPAPLDYRAPSIGTVTMEFQEYF